jgi:pre-mRNA-splicing helicase BRR2
MTHDNQLTKDEFERSQVVVCTPEKYDVVSRKMAGEGMDIGNVGLIVMDEVHLLDTSRGPVLEAIVARTKESCRLVGLSATLSNRDDVAKFLRVDQQFGLFNFDIKYRPSSLEIRIVGVPKTEEQQESKKKSTRIGDGPETKSKMNEVVYQEIIDCLKKDNKKQVRNYFDNYSI